MKRKLTPEEREARLERRTSARTAGRLKVQALRDWRQERQAAAVKRARTWRLLDETARRKLKKGERPRGVDRVPEGQRDLYRTVEPYTVGKHGTELAQPADRHPAGNYRDRRAQGQRGKQRRIRRRELPGAVERRLERARTEWLS